jgi:hypothetical protein
MESGFTWMRLGVMAACAAALLLIAEDYRKSVAPLRKRQAEALRDVARLGKRIADAQKSIAGIRTRETEVDRIRDGIDKAQAGLPPGSAGDAFPAWVKEHFAHCGITVPAVRLDSVQDEPGVSGYERGLWSVDLPIDEAGRNIASLLGAVADLDQRDSFVRVLEFEIRPDPEKPGARLGSLNLATVLRK